MKKSLVALATLVLAVACAPEFNPFTSGLTGAISGLGNWAEGSDFTYFAGTQAQEFTLTSGAGTQTAQFSAAGEAAAIEEVAGAVAVAPAFDKAAASYDGTTAQVVANFPATQKIAAAGQYPTPTMVAVAAKNAAKLNFLPAAGAVTVKLGGDNAVITKVEFTAAGKETINGTADITVEGGAIADVEMLEDGNNTIALECGEGIAVSKVAKEFSAFVPAGTYAKGFTVVVTAADGAQNTIEVEGPVTVTLGKATLLATATFAPFEDLNEANPETANCYVITKGGCYYFNATVKGNGAAGIHESFANAGADTDATLAPAGAKLVWAESEGLVSGVFFKDGKIYFSCNGKDGNAVVAATDADGNVIWSWHIWSTLAPETVECTETSGEMATHFYLNKNLGATDPKDHGLYYQWGRKDPFSKIIGFAKQDSEDEPGHHGCWYQQNEIPAELIAAGYNTVQYATANPMRYIGASSKSGNNDWFENTANFHWRWGIAHKEIGDAQGNANCSHSPFGKTIYDPCPAGYLVATPTGWANGGGWTRVDGGLQTYEGKLFVPDSWFIYNCGGGWWDNGGNPWSGLWSSSSSWGNPNNGFRLQDVNDNRSNYDPATGHPVRCEKLQK
ncbi:MAG: hypothetical protein MJY56_01150 [Bacteroidales bacterium]|nr:hypothetical protein [Bacteroidales bacterium]